MSRNGWRRMGRAVKKCQPDRSKFSILVARMFLTKGLQVPALAVTIGRASENVGQAKGLDQNGWRHTAGPKKHQPGARKIHRGKKRHTAGRATDAKKCSCKTCEKCGAGPIAERSTPSKLTEKCRAGKAKVLF